MPGKTFLSISAPNLSLARIMPERGPRSVLCVVEVTMSAYSQGLGCTPAATSPGEVRHVDQEDRADGIGDLAEALEVDDARDRRCRPR